MLFGLYLGAITDTMQRRLHVPRGLGVLIALLVTTAGVWGLGRLIVPPVAEQTQQLMQVMPLQMAQWEAQLTQLAIDSPFWQSILGEVDPRAGERYVDAIIAEIGGWFRNLTPYLFEGVTFLIHFVSVLVMGIFLALRPGLYKEGFITLAPPVHRDLVRDILTDLGTTLRAWIVGQLIAMTSLALFTWAGLEILQVDYALAFGVFTGVVAIVPFFGTLVSTILPALFVLGSAGAGKAMLVILLGVVVHLFEANIVAPMVMERQVHLPPVLTLLSVLIMAHLLHMIGLVVAVPVLASTMVITRRIYVDRVLEGKGFRRAKRDQAIEVQLPRDGVLVHPAALKQTVPALLEQ